MTETYKTRISLIERVQNQENMASWEEFTEIYRGFIYRIIREMNLSEQDAEDLTQTVLMTLWKKLPDREVKEIRRFRSWLSTVTRHCVIDFIRKRDRREKLYTESPLSSTSTSEAAISTSEIEEITETQWRIYLTNLALEKIRPFFSGHAIEVFHRTLAGESSQEIAEKLQIKEASVYRLRTRVKTRLIQEITTLRAELE